jgi:hypothetical protein
VDENIDALLDRFERELEYFALTRDRIAPLLAPLVTSLERYFAAPDAAARAEADIYRQRYIAALAAIEPLVRDWLSIRGAGELLWEADPFMSDAQAQRHQALRAREISETLDRTTFDTLAERARALLLLFEEATD